MEQWIEFNGVTILLTTGSCLSEVQNFLDRDPDVILSVYRNVVKVLRTKMIHRECSAEEVTRCSNLT